LSAIYKKKHKLVIEHTIKLKGKRVPKTQTELKALAKEYEKSVLLRHFFDVLIRRCSGSSRPPSLHAERVVVYSDGETYCCDIEVVRGEPTLKDCELISAVG
jgi:hypothetical protein